MLENFAHDKSCFVTLTYNDEYIPKNGSLSKEDYGKFIKRLRNYVSPRKYRFFGVGEYGSESLRPHYHFMLYNVGLDDVADIKKAWREGTEEKGFVMVGDVTPASCRYIAKYTIKRLTTKGKDFYERNPWLKGKCLEFQTSSKLEGGIGYKAIEKIAKKYKDDPKFAERVIRELKIDKKKVPLGRYLTKKLNDWFDEKQERIKDETRDYQVKLVDLGASCDGIHYENIVNSGKSKRLRLEKRHKIFNGKGII